MLKVSNRFFSLSHLPPKIMLLNLGNFEDDLQYFLPHICMKQCAPIWFLDKSCNNILNV